MWNNRYSMQVGMQNGTGSVKVTLIISYKAKHSLIMWSRSCDPMWFEIYVHTKTGICMFIGALFTQTGSSWDIHSIYIIRGTNISEILFSNKRNELPNHKKTQRDLKCILLSKKASLKSMVWFQLCNMLEKAKLFDACLPGVWMGMLELMSEWSTGHF